MTSGAFTAPYLDAAPWFEKSTHHDLVSVFGASTGGAADSIPTRLARGEPADVIIVSAQALDALIAAGEVEPGSRVDLVLSRIGVAVRAGAPQPDIGSVDALVRAVRAAESFAYSASVSGTYLSTELFPRLGLAEEVARERPAHRKRARRRRRRARRCRARLPANQRAIADRRDRLRRPAARRGAARQHVLRRHCRRRARAPPPRASSSRSSRRPRSAPSSRSYGLEQVGYDKEDWRALFNGRDLTGWTPKIRKHALGDNYAETFRVTRRRA